MTVCSEVISDDWP